MEKVNNKKLEQLNSTDRDNKVPNIPSILQENPNTGKTVEPGIAELKILNL